MGPLVLVGKGPCFGWGWPSKMEEKKVPGMAWWLPWWVGDFHDVATTWRKTRNKCHEYGTTKRQAVLESLDFHSFGIFKNNEWFRIENGNWKRVLTWEHAGPKRLTITHHKPFSWSFPWKFKLPPENQHGYPKWWFGRANSLKKKCHS